MTSSIKIRARIKNTIAEVRVLIRHPMSVALRDPVSGEVQQAHFIKEVICEHNGNIVMQSHWGQGISKNPYLAFHIKGAKKGDSLRISWSDNKDNSDTKEVKL